MTSLPVAHTRSAPAGAWPRAKAGKLGPPGPEAVAGAAGVQRRGAGAQLDGEGAPLSTVEILGVPIVACTADRMIERIRSATQRGRVRLAYANAHTLNLACGDPALRQALRHSDFVLNDGIGVALAARMKGARFPENLNGSDFTVRVLKLAAREGWAVFLLGGRAGIAERAAAELHRAIAGLQIAGTRHGFHGRADLDADAVRASDAEVLLVAMGNPRQELWLAERLAELPRVRLGVAVGAFLDFQAGALPRAPAWMNRWGVEWLYRLAHEPRRLAERYLLGNPRFMARVAREQMRRAGRSAHTRAGGG